MLPEWKSLQYITITKLSLRKPSLKAPLCVFFCLVHLSASSLKLKCAWARLASLQQLFIISNWAPHHHKVDGRQVLCIWPCANSPLMCNPCEWVNTSLFKAFHHDLKGQQVSSAHLQFDSIQLTCELPWSDLYLKENAVLKSNRRSFDGRASKRKPLTNFHWCKSREFYAKMNAATPPSSSHEKVRNKNSGICIIMWNSNTKVDTEFNFILKKCLGQIC